MKKILLCCLVIITASQFIKAQDQKFRIGVAVTPAINWVNAKFDGKKVDGYKSVMGLGYGIIVDYYFAERYAFSTGLFASHGGAKFKTNTGIDSLDFETKLKLMYLSVPLTLKLTTSEFGSFKPYFHAGVTPGFAVVKKFVVDGDEEKADGISPFNLSFTAGAGTEYRISDKTSAFAGLHLDYGLLDIEKDSDDATLKKSLVGLHAGIYF